MELITLGIMSMGLGYSIMSKENTTAADGIIAGCLCTTGFGACLISLIQVASAVLR